MKSSMSSRDISFGVACDSSQGMADGAQTSSGHPPYSFFATPPGLSHGARVLALRPACPSWICFTNQHKPLSGSKYYHAEEHRLQLRPRFCRTDHNVLTLRMSKLDDFSQRLDLAVFPQAIVFRRDSSVCSDSSGFYCCKSWSTLDNTPHVGCMPHRIAKGIRSVVRTTNGSFASTTYCPSSEEYWHNGESLRTDSAHRSACIPNIEIGVGESSAKSRLYGQHSNM